MEVPETSKFCPTNKLPPVVVIPPADASVVTPVTLRLPTFNTSTLIDGASIPSTELIVTPVPTVITLVLPSTVIVPVPKVAIPVTFMSPFTYNS